VSRVFAGVIFSALLSSTVFSQTAISSFTAAKPVAASPAFDVADVRPSPKVRAGTIYTDGGGLHGDRYALRQATMVDLIARAYGIHNDENIRGGPSWLERDRFNIIAKAKPNTPPTTLNLMLKSLLADRFHLVVHNEDRPMPAYILSLGKSKPKLKQSTGDGESDCHNANPSSSSTPRDPTQSVAIICQNFDADQIASLLENVGQSASTPVVNHTGLEGKWDFEFQWTRSINVSDLVENQLGLKLDRQTMPLPVLVVDSVSEQPTPNLPDIDKRLPPAPPAKFEVAVIRPSKEGAGGFTRIDNSQVNAKGITLYELIGYAWRLNQNDNAEYVNEPKWLESTRFDLNTKVSTADLGSSALLRDDDDLRHMVQALLIERFNLKVHMEERPLDAYTLLAVNPKLHQADPTVRTRCTEGPGPDGKDPRIANPVRNRLITCQNMTMAQLSEELGVFAGGYIHNPVVDGTDLKGGWDFTISFSGVNKARQSGNDDSDPNGAVTIFSALSKDLGLKLEKQKRLLPVLVIDHVDETPTEN
jgi:uncharacterized protein (TIGR03435 family)